MYTVILNCKISAAHVLPVQRYSHHVQQIRYNSDLLAKSGPSIGRRVRAGHDLVTHLTSTRIVVLNCEKLAAHVLPVQRYSRSNFGPRAFSKTAENRPNCQNGQSCLTGEKK